mmetsp:Transcript_127740/g.190364  ORF Transcript_127740/g.190364 Transcript_127740/m.190364 type:complete len:103 (+) Transcript_127740:27-335(+)
MGKHTIVLVQESRAKSSRSFYDYETVAAACEGIRKKYEAQLAQLNPRVKHISYSIAELNTYLDSLGDISCLVYNEAKKAYEPYDRQWVKNRISRHLNQQSRR